MPRALTTSATACRLLWRKAELAGMNTQAMEAQEVQIASLKDVNRKWHIPPSFRFVILLFGFFSVHFEINLTFIYLFLVLSSLPISWTVLGESQK